MGKIKKVFFNNKKKSFLIHSSKRIFEFPYARLDLKPNPKDGIARIFSDPELGHSAFTYVLHSGKEGTIHLDQVLEYNRDANYMREMLLYKLSLKAQALLKHSRTSKRAIMRRMGTSPTQFYRLLDQTNTGKTIDQMTKLLSALDCRVDVVFKRAA